MESRFYLLSNSKETATPNCFREGNFHLQNLDLSIIGGRGGGCTKFWTAAFFWENDVTPHLVLMQNRTAAAAAT